MKQPRDRFARPLGSLRISVTDRCNMRCRYCMPEEDYVWLPRESLLTFEEITRLAKIFSSLGARKIRLTGGEPLLRHDLATLVRLLKSTHPTDLALTTNGILLSRLLPDLLAAGLDRVTVSLDTLRPERMMEFTRSNRHADVIAGIAAARGIGIPVKLNAVIVRGYNDDEILDLLAFARTQRAELRFVEYMDVGGATRWETGAVVTRDEILAVVASQTGEPVPMTDDGDPAPASRYRLPDGTVIGIVASVSAPFCAACDRGRLTADGSWYLCLYADQGLSLREPLRLGASDEELASLIAATWRSRVDRGAEARLATPGRGVLHQVTSLRADPHREMHTRGG